MPDHPRPAAASTRAAATDEAQTLTVEGLSVSYDTGTQPIEALSDISLAVAPGQALGVVGESGCGKSTLSAAILQLLPRNGRISAGSVRLDGQELTELDAEQLRRVRGDRIGMVFQDPLTSLNPAFRIGTQMVDAMEANGVGASTSERRERAIAMLARVGIPDPESRIDGYPHQFSGGMRQRIMIATVLLLEPALLIADEATSALDVTLQAQILTLLRQLAREEGAALIVISHDIGVISDVCEDMLVLYAGRIVESGPVDDVLAEPEHPYTQALLSAVPSHRQRHGRLATIPGSVPSLTALPQGCAFAPRCPHAQDVCTAREPDLVTSGTRRVRCVMADPTSGYDHTAAPVSEPEQGDVTGHLATDAATLLEVRDLEVRFDAERTLLDRVRGREASTVRAVDGVSLALRRGEALGLVGESGSGKTTLGKAVLGLAPVSGGEVRVDGVRVDDADARAWRGLRRRMQMIFQEPYGSLSPRRRVAHLVTEPYRIMDVPPSEQRDVDELLEMVGLSREQADKYPHQLSGGQARRVGIARALALRPEVIVADEPTAGLDVSAAAGILNLLGSLRRDLGLTMLLITHDLNMVGYVADRVAVMYLGSVVEVGDSARVLDHPSHPYTRALLASIPDPAKPRGAGDADGGIQGEIPSPTNPPSGCRFRTRCAFADERCAAETPPLRDHAGRLVACHHAEEIASGQRRPGDLPMADRSAS